MAIFEQDPDVIHWVLDILNCYPSQSPGYCECTVQNDASYCSDNYGREGNITDHSMVENDEVIAHALQEEFQQLAIAEASGPSHADGDHSQASVLAQDWLVSPVRNYNYGSEGPREDVDDMEPSTLCSNPEGNHHEGEELSLELTDDFSALDGEVDKRLNQMVPIPHNIPIPNHLSSASPASAPVSALEDADLAMAINASLQSAVTEGLASGMPSEVQNDNANGWTNTENINGCVAPDRRLSSAEAPGGWANETGDDGFKGWSFPASKPNKSTQNQHENQQSLPAVPLSQNIPQTLTAPDATPSAPPLSDDIFTLSSISYPSGDSSPIDQPRTATQGKSTIGEPQESKGDSGTCVICLDAPVEGACVPCGHVAGCMPCLTEIKAKQWGCPVCRKEIDQVVKLHPI